MATPMPSAMYLAFLVGCAATPGVTPPVPVVAPVTVEAIEIHVVSEGPLPSNVQSALVSRVRTAFEFAYKANGWSTAMREPLELRIGVLPRGTLARTTGPHIFSVASDALDREDVDGVFAHELTHLQDFRGAGRGLRSVPRYLEEGKALTVGQRYRATLHECGSDSRRRRDIAALSGAKVEQVLRELRDGAGLRAAGRAGETFQWMSAASFFVEYLQTHGVPDALPRLTRVWERLSTGEAFDAAFAAVFQQPLDAVEKAYVEFMTQTEGDSDARLRGTSFERECEPAAPPVELPH
jgi:hypothetical protein